MMSIRNLLGALAALILLLLPTAPLTGEMLIGSETRSISADETVESGRSGASLPFIKPEAAQTTVSERAFGDILFRASIAERPTKVATAEHRGPPRSLDAPAAHRSLLCVFRL